MTIIPTTIKSKKLVEKRREQIALAAINLFSKKGFHKSTLRELSEEAGISHGNIYDLKFHRFLTLSDLVVKFRDIFFHEAQEIGT